MDTLQQTGDERQRLVELLAERKTFFVPFWAGFLESFVEEQRRLAERQQRLMGPGYTIPRRARSGAAAKGEFLLSDE